MNRMIYCLVFITFVLSGPESLLFGEARSPKLVVQAFIEAIQRDDQKYIENYVDLESIQNQSRHSYGYEDLQNLFKEVDVTELKFGEIVQDHNINETLIKLLSPISFQFKLKRLPYPLKKKARKEDCYCIIAIYP